MNNTFPRERVANVAKRLKCAKYQICIKRPTKLAAPTCWAGRLDRVHKSAHSEHGMFPITLAKHFHWSNRREVQVRAAATAATLPRAAVQSIRQFRLFQS